MDDVWTVVIGFAVGLAVIGVVNAFPGDPFDYDRAITPPSTSAQRDTAKNSTTVSQKDMAYEVDVAARQLKVQKLQELLGLEKHEVQKMIDQAKVDALNGRQPRASVNYSRWLDMAFYGVIGVLLVFVLRTEYNVDFFQLLGEAFPREAETVRKIAALIPANLIMR